MINSSDQEWEAVTQIYCNLNDLLSQAKTLEGVWSEWNSHPDGWERPGWKPCYLNSQAAWTELVEAIRAAPKPLFFTGEDGTERSINTCRVVDADLMMRYIPEGKTIEKGYRLTLIQHFGALQADTTGESATPYA